MIKLGESSSEGPSTRQKVLTKCMWLLGTCRNAIVVVASGALGFWFVATHGAPPFRLMGQSRLCTSRYIHNAHATSIVDRVSLPSSFFLCTLFSR